MEKHLRDIHYISITVHGCVECNHFFSFVKEKLEIHQKLHSKQETFACPSPECSFTTDSNDALLDHCRTHEVANYRKKERFKCERCAFSTLKLHVYNRHCRLVHKIDQYSGGSLVNAGSTDTRQKSE